MNADLEQRLHDDMERATQGVHVPPGLALKAYRHRKRAVRTRTVTAAGATAVLAAGSLTVAGASGAFGHQAGGQRIATDAYVISRVERALSTRDMNNMVGHTRTVDPPGVTLRPVPGGVNGSGAPGSQQSAGGYEVVWAYHRTSKMSAFTATGQRIFDERITAGRQSLATTAVSYPSHTWWTAQSPRPAVSGASSAGCLPRGEIRLGGGGNAWPDFIRSQLRCGAYTVVGRQAAGGVDAIEIKGSGGFITLWVDPATYLPIRLTAGGVQIAFQWLTATPANLAMLNMPVPAGFHRVPPPAPASAPGS